MEKCEGCRSSLRAKAASYTVPMAVGPCFLGQCFSPRPACSPPAWGKEWRHHPTSHQHYLSPFGGNAEETEDIAPFLTPATRLQKLYLQALPAVQELPALDGLPSLYALKLYELHKLSDLSALSLSHLRYFAASLIADKTLRSGAGRCCDGRFPIWRQPHSSW